MVCRSKVWKAPARDFILPRLVEMSTQGAGDRTAVCKISIFNNIMIIVTSWSPQTWSEALATPGLHTLATLRPTVWSTGCPPSHNDGYGWCRWCWYSTYCELCKLALNQHVYLLFCKHICLLWSTCDNQWPMAIVKFQDWIGRVLIKLVFTRSSAIHKRSM